MGGMHTFLSAALNVATLRWMPGQVDEPVEQNADTTQAPWSK